MIGKCLDPHALRRVKQCAVELRDGRGLAARDESDVDRELLGHPNQEQIRMERSPRHGMDLDTVDEHRVRLVTVHRQVDQRVRPDTPAQDLELVRVDRHVRRVDAVAVDDGRQAAGGSELLDGLAGHLAGFGGQRRAGGCHGLRTSG